MRLKMHRWGTYKTKVIKDIVKSLQNSWLEGLELISLPKVKCQHKPDLTILRLITSSHTTQRWVLGGKEECQKPTLIATPTGEWLSYNLPLLEVLPVLKKQNHERV